MNITVEQLPDCKATVRIEVPADQVEKERDSIIKAFSKQAKLPGFRPGKAPKRVIEKKYSKAIEEELKERLMRAGYQEAIKKESLQVLNIADVADPTFHEDKTFTFSAEITTAPQIELPDYKGIPVKVPKLEITDEQVEQTLENLRQRYATFDDITAEDHGLEDGDFAVIDYSGTLDGKPLAEAVENVTAYLAGNQGYWVKMDEESFLPGFCAGIIGTKIGEERTVSVTLAEDFPVEALREKDIEYKVTLTGIKEQKLPELDDEFAKKVAEDKNLEDLRTDIREQLEEEAKREIENIKTNQILAHLDENLQFDLPPELITGETQRRVNDIAARAQKSGMSDDELMKHQDEIINSASQQARSNVKSSFILEEIAKAEKLEVSQGELTQAVTVMAMRSGVPPKKYMKEMQKENGFGRIRDNILLEKALTFLKENAEIEEVDAPEEEAES